MVSSTVAGAKLPFGSCRMRPAFTTLMQRRVDAAVGGVGVGEIALLQRQPPEIVTRHGADLVQLADQEVGKRRLRLSWLAELVAGDDGMLCTGCRLMRRHVAAPGVLAWHLSRARCAAPSARRRVEPAELKLHQPVHRLELGLQVLEPRIMLALELIDEFVELSLMGVDLLFKQSRPGLASPREYHALLAPRCMTFAPTTERAGRFTQDQTNPAWPPRPASIPRSRHCLGRAASVPHLNHRREPLSRLCRLSAEMHEH